MTANRDIIKWSLASIFCVTVVIGNVGDALIKGTGLDWVTLYLIRFMLRLMNVTYLDFRVYSKR